MSHACVVHCHWCQKIVRQRMAYITRALRAGNRLFCDRKCAGLARRKNKTVKQKKLEKRLYDMQYRRKNLKRLKAQKKAYFILTYDPIKAARARKKRMPLHVEYCRQPEYRKYKRAYDEERRATNLHASVGLPQWAPISLAESIKLLRTIRKEQKREHKRA